MSPQLFGKNSCTKLFPSLLIFFLSNKGYIINLEIFRCQLFFFSQNTEMNTLKKSTNSTIRKSEIALGMGAQVL